MPATRKLQKVGGGTYTVSVPKEWVTEHSLSAGDQVTIHSERDGSLILRGECDREDASTTVALETARRGVLSDALRAAYAAGSERITLSREDGLDQESRRPLDRLVQDLTGTRVVDATEDCVRIRTAIDDEQVSLQRIVVQVQFVALSLFRTATDTVLSSTEPGGDRIDDRRDDVAALVALLTRQFTRSLSRAGTAAALDVDRTAAFEYYRTVAALDRVADLSVDIAAVGDDGPVSEDALAPFRTAAEAVRLYVEEATNAVVESRPKGAPEDLRDARSTLETRLGNLDEGDEGGQARELALLLAACADAGDRIADVARESAIRQDRERHRP